MRRGLALALCALPLSAVGQSSPTPSPSPPVALTTSCQWSTSQGTWDLSPLTLASSTYTTTDARDSSLSYYYNFCKAALAEAPGFYPDPKQQGANSACNTPRLAVTSPRTSWQYDDCSKRNPPGPAGCSNDNCYRLGSVPAYGWSFSVFDALKPARGIVMQYPGGDSDWCPFIPGSFSVRKNRTFSIELLCAPTQGTPAQFASSNVIEANVCDYRVQLKSLAGCPTTCITGNTMCSGNGICGFNTDTQRNQCFCNAGSSGPQCASVAKASTGLGAEGVILIIVCIMLAGVLGLVGYMFMRLRKLTVDPSAYGELQGKYNELSMVS